LVPASAPSECVPLPVQVRHLGRQRVNAQETTVSAPVPGVIINHSPASSQRYIGSPSLAILSSGDYVASHDLFGPKANHTRAATTLVFASRDRGRTWQQISSLIPSFWGKLFVHRHRLYLLGTSHEYGNLLIRRSDDGSRTWTAPEGPTTGLLRRGRYHCAPCPILIHNERIWRSIEQMTGMEWGAFDALVMSTPGGAELLAAASWTFSQPLPRQRGFCWLEGNVVLDPDGKVVNLLRTNGAGDDKSVCVSVSEDGLRLAFRQEVDIIDMPGGGAKFTIRYDDQTSRYWTIVNKQTRPTAYRNNLILASSADLRTWQVQSPLLYDKDARAHAWQYVDWQFDRDDIIFVSRTAYDDGLGGAHSAHDANYLTFHRIKNFRRSAGMVALSDEGPAGGAGPERRRDGSK